VEALAAGTEIRILLVLGHQRVEIRSAGPTRVRELRADSRGRVEINGSVVEVDAAQLVVVAPTNAAEEWVIHREEVARVLRVDPEEYRGRKGMLIGAVAGAGAWLVVAVGDSDLDASSWEGLLIGGGIGALIGGLSDTLRDTEETTLVYRAPPEALQRGDAEWGDRTSWCLVRLRMGDLIGDRRELEGPTFREAVCQSIRRYVIESSAGSRDAKSRF
jgi:hypothetical protein